MAKGKTKSRTAENLKPAAVLEISWIDREKLVPNPENPRDNRNAVEAVAASIQKFGWRSPLVARRDSLMLEAGHTRLAAGRGPDVPIYDPFAGSATTLLAAIKQKRRAIGVEIEPRIVDAAVRRIQKATGEAAKLKGTAKTFEEVEAERKRGED